MKHVIKPHKESGVVELLFALVPWPRSVWNHTKEKWRFFIFLFSFYVGNLSWHIEKKHSWQNERNKENCDYDDVKCFRPVLKYFMLRYGFYTWTGFVSVSNLFFPEITDKRNCIRDTCWCGPFHRLKWLRAPVCSRAFGGVFLTKNSLPCALIVYPFSRERFNQTF